MSIKLKRRAALDSGELVTMRIEVPVDVRDRLKAAKTFSGMPVYELITMLVRQHIVLED